MLEEPVLLPATPNLSREHISWHAPTEPVRTLPLNQEIGLEATDLEERQEEPGLVFGSFLYHGMCTEGQNVGVLKKQVHLYLVQSFLTIILVMAYDAFQGIEAPILQPFDKVHIAEATAGNKIE